MHYVEKNKNPITDDAYDTHFFLVYKILYNGIPCLTSHMSQFY